MDVRRRAVVCAAAVVATVSLMSSAAIAAAPVTSAYDWAQFGGGVTTHAQSEPDGDITYAALGVGPTLPTPVLVPGLIGKQIVQISTSNSNDYALTKSGEVYAWGAGSQGELGDGTRPEYSSTAVRVKFPSGIKISSLPNPAPYDAGMAIASNHTVWGWGNDLNQQFCRHSETTIATPIKIALKDVTLAVGARSHTTYDSDGRIVSCGAGPVGQLGDGVSGPASQTGTPEPVLGLPPEKPVQLTAGWGNTGVLMANGDYYDWGFNADGQVGNGTNVRATSAVRVALPSPVMQVSLGGSFSNNGQTMVILENGSLWEWGDGQSGQLGGGRTKSVNVPVKLTPPAGVQFVFVNSGGSTDYAIDRTGHIWSAGANWDFQLGYSTTANESSVWTKIPLAHATAVSSTAHNVFAYTTTGS